MKAVLIATDLIKNESGDIKVLETNTNAWTTHNFSLFDFSGLTNFIENNNFSEVHFIIQNFNRTLTPYIQQIAESKNATFTEYLVDNTAITVPYVEDSESKLIIRLSYDTTAVIDDDYCRDKYKLQKLIHEQSYAIDTYVPTEFDDFENIEDFTYTDNLPNFIVKYRYPNYDKEVYPKLYKIENLNQLNSIKEGLPSDTYIQRCVLSELIDGRRNIIRSLDLLCGSNLDVVNMGSYYVINQIPETIWENEFDETGVLSKKNRPKYITHTSLHIDSNFDYVFDVDQDVLLADGTSKTFDTLEIGDEVRALHIPDLNLDETTYELSTWTSSWDSFITGSGVVTTAVTKIRKSNSVSTLFVRITLDDGNTWDDLKSGPILIKDNNEIQFKLINDLEIGSTICTFDTTNNSVGYRTIQNIEIIFKENQILATMDVEPTDLYLPLIGNNLTLIQHNLCRNWCSSEKCADSGFCNNCSYYYCNK